MPKSTGARREVHVGPVPLQRQKAGAVRLAILSGHLSGHLLHEGVEPQYCRTSGCGVEESPKGRRAVALKVDATEERLRDHEAGTVISRFHVVILNGERHVPHVHHSRGKVPFSRLLTEDVTSHSCIKKCFDVHFWGWGPFVLQMRPPHLQLKQYCFL